MDASRRRTWALVTVSLATFMTYLDNNIVNVAIPAIQRDLGLTTSGLEWVVSGYILAFASLLLAGGRLGDIFGRRRLFLVGLGVFTVASLAAGLAGNVDVLVASRAVQGIGAALVTPTTLAIISAIYRNPRERTVAIGIWSAVGALSLAVGPVLGGLISEHLDWGWIFYLNVPVGVATMALAVIVVPADVAVARRRIDLPGVTASALALLGLTYGLIEGHDKGWTSTPILGSFAVAAAAALAFVLIERRSPEPMVDMHLFSERVFTGGIIAIVMWGFGLFGIYFFTSLYLQNVLAFSPTEAGAAFVPMALLMAVGAVLAERVAGWVGPYRSVSGGMLLMAAGIGSVALLGRDASFLDLMPSFALIGIGGGLSVTLTAMIIGTMPDAEAGVASGIFNAAREVAGLLGITVIGAILTARQSVAARGGSDPVDSFLSGYRSGLLVAAVLVAAGGVAAFLALRATSKQDQTPAVPAAAEAEATEYALMP
jgi:EmrB/QacA subfamily drug resistance transporter